MLGFNFIILFFNINLRANKKFKSKNLMLTNRLCDVIKKSKPILKINYWAFPPQKAVGRGI